jgi:Mg2+/citrate symporter
LKFWATTILIFIGIGVVAMIVIQIVFHILLSIAIAVKEQVRNGKCDDKEVEKAIEQEMVEDEMDKLIGLKSMRIGFAVTGFGFIAALVSLVLNYSPAVMLNILFFAFGIGSMIEGITQLYFYRRGVKNA